MKLLPNVMTVKLGRAVLQAKKNSPHIFFGAGVVGGVGTVVLACRATLKLEKVIDETSVEVKRIKAVSEKSINVTEKDYQKAIGTAYCKAGVKLAKLYGPSVVLGVASVGMLAGSHVQLTRRNAALTSTLALVSKSFEDYRQRVKEEYGEEKELNIYRGVEEKAETIDGKKTKVLTKTGQSLSPYAVCFDPSNQNHVKSAEENGIFLRAQQNHCNYLLQARGHVLLNDAYDLLGFPRTSAGAIMGWVKDKGDGFVDFGIFNAANEDFHMGREWNIWLDFNVHGVVYDQI